MVIRWLAAVSCAGLAWTGCAPVGEDLGIDNDFGVWDTDDDGLLDDDEFGYSWGDTFDTWDEDDSGYIEESEWNEFGVGVNGDTFDTWDADNDGLLDDDEFADGSFGMMDNNGDGFLDENEWNTGLEAR